MKLFYSKFIVLIFVIQFFQSNAQNISQQLVGTNVWYTNPSQQVWNLTAEMGTQTIRIGGHAYDDNMPSKTTLLNWVKKIQAMGAEPIIQVSQYQSAVAAADLVRYLNVEKSDEIAPVKFWNIGNEPWLQNGRPSLSTVGAMVETYFKPRAEAMKEVDPTIKIYGPDFCYYIEPAINDLFGGKNDIAGKIPGKEYYYCDGISWHRYPQDENINLAYQGIEDFRSSIVKCKNKVDAVNAAYNRTGDDALVWGIGEFNAKGGPQVHTWENGQMFGGILGLCMKYSAKYATSWSMFENGGNRQGTDFSLIDGENMTPRASYRHMEFVAKYCKGEYIDGTSSSNDFVVYGAQDETQTAVMIMHRASGSSKEYTLLLNDTATSDASFKLKINAGLIGSYSDIITARTTQVLIFHGDSITKINYSAEDFDNELPPVYSLLKLGQVLPEKPSGLQVNSVSYNSVTLTWNDNSGNETGFIVEIEEAGRFKIITVLPPDSTSYTNKGLLPETSYKFKISAYNSLGKSEYSEFVSAITLETPAAVAFKGPHSIPGKIEAENFNANEAGIGFFDTDAINEGGEYRTTGVDIENSTDTGGGYNIGYINNGEWLRYHIENVMPGIYNVAFRTASDITGTHQIDVFLGENKVGSLFPKNTGGWQNWESLYLENIEIATADPVDLTLKFSGKEFNINWIEFEKLNTSASDNLHQNEIQVIYNSRAKVISITSGNGSKSVLNVINSAGQSFYKSVYNGLNKMEINTSGWTPGMYFVIVSNQIKRHTEKLIIY